MHNSQPLRQSIAAKYFAYLLPLLTLVFSPTVLFAQGQWTAASSDGFTGRFGASACVIDDKIYVIGGQNQTENLEVIEMYDPKTDTWAKPSVVNGYFTPRRHVGVAVVNGKIYTLGGDTGVNGAISPVNIVESFDPISNTWSTIPTTGLEKPLRGLKTVVANNKVYAFFGGDSSNVVTPIIVFDPATNKWEIPITSGSCTPRRSATVAVINDKVYVIGGLTGLSPSFTFYNTVDVFDLKTHTWNNIQTTGYCQKRSGMTSQVINGKIYVMGGSDGVSNSNALEILDPTTRTWSTPATTGTFSPRNGLGSAMIDGKIYVIGGAGYNSIWNKNEVLDPHVIDPSSIYGTWTTGSSVGFTARAYSTASAVNGKIYVVGGYDSNAVVNTMQVYDPATDSWSTPATTGTFTPRRYATTNVVNGKIYVIGGYDISSLATDIDVFDPNTNSWSTLTTTGDYYYRAYHTSAVVNGRIYIFGGEDGVGYIDIVDEFDPATNTWLSLSTTGLFDVRHALTSCSYKDKVYVHGGFNSYSRTWCNWIDVFDQKTNSWSEAQISRELTPNCFLSSGLINGKMYIIGGNTPTGLLRIVNAYDVETTKVCPVITTGAFTPRNSTACVTLEDKIYVLGGYFYEGTSEAILNTVEIFTPAPVNTVANSRVVSDKSAITPNPASSVFTVSGLDGDALNVKVFDLLGKVLMTAKPTERHVTVDISMLPSGVYYVKIDKSSGSEMQVLIKK